MKTLHSRYLMPSALSAVTVFAFAAPAHAFEFKVSGQVDRAAIAADNGEDRDIGFVDNVGSNSRFRFTGAQDLDNGYNIGFAYEIGLNENPSTSFDVNNGGGSEDDFLDNRLANVYVEGDFGRFTFGKLDGAANGSSELNYSGTMYLGGGQGISLYAGGVSFLDDEGRVITNLSAASNHFDGISRQNGVRYDTPSLGGAVLSASLDNGHAYELAARYETAFADGGKAGFVLSHLDTQDQDFDIEPDGTVNDNSPRFQETGGTGSLLLPSGITLTASYKQRDYMAEDRATAENYFGGVGYVLDKHHFEASYMQTNDLAGDGSKGRSYGLAYVYDVIDSVELFASYHHLTLDDASYSYTETDAAGDDINITATGDAQDLDILYVGTRLKFL